nr:hypothetical protein [Paraburkholderia sp. NMBU_R16]
MDRKRRKGIEFPNYVKVVRGKRISGVGDCDYAIESLWELPGVDFRHAFAGAVKIHGPSFLGRDATTRWNIFRREYQRLSVADFFEEDIDVGFMRRQNESCSRMRDHRNIAQPGWGAGRPSAMYLVGAREADAQFTAGDEIRNFGIPHVFESLRSAVYENLTCYCIPRRLDMDAMLVLHIPHDKRFIPPLRQDKHLRSGKERSDQRISHGRHMRLVAGSRKRRRAAPGDVGLRAIGPACADARHR